MTRQAQLERAIGDIDEAPAIGTDGVEPLAFWALRVLDRLARDRVTELDHRNRGPAVDSVLEGFYSDAPDLLCLARYNGTACPHCAGLSSPTSRCFGAPYCARAARWAYEAAAAELHGPRLFVGWGDLASTAKWLRAGRRFGRLVEAPRPGDVGLILGDEIAHTVLLATAAGDAWWTREGNSGDGFAARLRKTSSFSAFVRIAPEAA